MSLKYMLRKAKGGKGNTQGWVKIDLPPELYERLRAFAASVPPAWTCDNQGRTRAEGGKAEQHFHVTFLLQLADAPAKLASLRAILAETDPITLQLGPLFCTPVGRITRRRVLCVGVPIEDDHQQRLRQLRERCAAVIGGQVWFPGV